MNPNKKGLSLSIESVVIIVVLLFVLIIVAGFFFGGFGRSAGGISGIGKGGEEAASEIDTKEKIEEAQGSWGPPIFYCCVDPSMGHNSAFSKKKCDAERPPAPAYNVCGTMTCADMCYEKGYSNFEISGGFNEICKCIA